MYSTLYKSFFKNDSSNNKKKGTSISFSNNSNSYSLKGIKESKKNIENSDNESSLDEKEFCDFDEMINIFNKKYRNIVCNQIYENNKDNSFNTLENYENNTDNAIKVNSYIHSRNIENKTKENLSLIENVNLKTGDINQNFQNYENNNFNDNMKIEVKSNKNANSYIVTPKGKNNKNINLIINSNSKNESTYSKSFIMKSNITNENNTNINLISKYNNYNIVYSKKNKDPNLANDEKAKKKLLKKFPNKINLNIGKKNTNNNKNSHDKRVPYKTEKKVARSNDGKETINSNSKINYYCNNNNNQINSNKKLIYNNNEEIISRVNLNNISSNNSILTNQLNNYYYKQIISNNKCLKITVI